MYATSIDRERLIQYLADGKGLNQLSVFCGWMGEKYNEKGCLGILLVLSLLHLFFRIFLTVIGGF